MVSYSTPTNLVLVIGASPQEAEYLVRDSIEAVGVECDKPPRCVTSDVSVGDRLVILWDARLRNYYLVSVYLLKHHPYDQIGLQTLSKIAKNW